ncbi:MAG TPA: Uma2 family endonuclease [Gemmataceae bacterium]|nr:Uma2 family endonuclease [Gemmataceae bacterium]
MATARAMPVPWQNGYPTSDGKPMAETDWHRELMTDLIRTLKAWYAKRRVYVSGNLLLFYEPGNRRRHICPDVFVVKGIAKHERPNYLLWEERKGPEVVIELTSSSTRREDIEDKYRLYRGTLHVKEYFLFDPLGDYLQPPLQGHRLRHGDYQPIRFVDGRLPSQVLGLHLERNGRELRLYDLVTGRRLPTPSEAAAQAETARRQEEAARRQAEAVSQHAEAARQQAEAARQQAERENEQLRRELAALRCRLPKNHRTG